MVKKFFKWLFTLNDTAPRIALGLSIGVFFGVLPAAGTFVSLIVAAIFRANKAAAVLGNLLSNTWITVTAFILSIKIGSAIMGLDWHNVWNNSKILIKDFHWANLFKTSMLNILAPVVLGYFIMAAIAGILTYIITRLIFAFKKTKAKPRS